MTETMSPMESQLDSEIRRRHARALTRSAVKHIQQDPRAVVDIFDELAPEVWVNAVCELLAGSMTGDLRERLVARLGDPETDEMLHYLSLCALPPGPPRDMAD